MQSEHFYYVSEDGIRYWPDEMRSRREAERWVDPNGERREKRQWSYSYSEFYIWGGPDGRKAARDAVYSDRLWQWDHEKFNRCCKEVAPNKRWDQMSAKQVSEWLTMYFGKPTKATAVAEGCNASNGYPYWIIWFRDADEKPAT